MKITALVENSSMNENIEPEHGLSLYIEVGDKKLLFDMGQSDLFFENAKKLNINLSDIDIAVLSHGHYDHGGGLRKFLEVNQKAKIYINRNAFLPYYNGDKYIGLDVTLKDNDRIIYTDDEYRISDSLTLFSCNNNDKKFELGAFGLSKIQDNIKVSDDFLHEQYLLINDGEKDVLISGCSHKGVLDITRWFSPSVLVGGFHFSKLELDDTLESYCDYLSSFDTLFYTCHCTGVEQFEFMKKYMKNLSYLSSGMTIEV